MPNDYATSHNLGSNRFCYLIGDVGVGKSILVMKLIDQVRDMAVDHNGFRLLPVYVDFERMLLGDPTFSIWPPPIGRILQQQDAT